MDYRFHQHVQDCRRVLRWSYWTDLGELAQLTSLYSGDTLDNSVNKVTGYGTDDLESIPDRRPIFLHYHVQTAREVQPTSYPMVTEN